MPEILEILMGSKSRARIMRFFVLNPGKEFLFADVREKTQMTVGDVRKEVSAFEKIGLLTVTTRDRKKYYSLNEGFVYYNELRNLYVKSNVYPQCTEVRHVKRIGSVKLAMISGVFMNYQRSEIDLLIVADDVSRAKLDQVIAAIEAEIGKEVRYMLLRSEDFQYRLDMMDRFLIEFFSGPHDAIINKVPRLSRFIAEMKR
jgi:DNA-binding MarR family transcriptional regulator